MVGWLCNLPSRVQDPRRGCRWNTVVALLSSTAGRLFVIAYMAAMHLLVFVSSYYIAHKHDCPALTPARAAPPTTVDMSHQNQFGWTAYAPK